MIPLRFLDLLAWGALIGCALYAALLGIRDAYWTAKRREVAAVYGYRVETFPWGRWLVGAFVAGAWLVARGQ